MTQPTPALGIATIALDKGNRRLLVPVDGLRELHRHTVAGVQTPGGPEREVGGFLLGSEADGEVVIDSIREIPNQRRVGSAFALSERERAEARAIAAAEAPRQVVGIYRSHLREGQLVQPADVELAATFPGIRLIVIVMPSTPTRSVCRVFLRGAHGVWALSGSFAIPEIPEPLPAGPAGTHVAAAPRRGGRFGAAVVWGIPAILALLVFLFWWFPPRRATQTPGAVSTAPASVTPPAAVSDSGLELRLERSAGGDIKITWNRQAPAVLSAAGGLLRIREGNSQRDLELDAAQLRSGNLLYVNAGGDIIFRMEVRDNGGRLVTESVRLIGGKAVAAARPQEVLPLPVIKINPKGSVDRLTPAPEPQTPVPERKVLVTPVKPLTAGTVSLPSPDPFGHAPGLTPPPVTRPLATPPPPVASAPATKSPVQTTPAQSVASQSAPAQATVTQAAVPQPGVVPSATEQLADPILPARALRQIRPVVPPNVKALITQNIALTVTVVVDDAGKVVSATPDNAPTVVGRMLSAIATEAARGWRFEPARRNGQPVSSTVALVFRFSR